MKQNITSVVSVNKRLSCMSFIKGNFLETASMIETFLNEERNLKNIEELVIILADKHKNGFKGLTCGNGGSACDAMHYAEELTGRFRHDRIALAAISLTDASHITCVANDFGFEHIFSRGVEAYGRAGDYLVAISTSGNSQNVIKAVEVAQNMNMLTIGILGKDGGKLRDMTDFTFIFDAKTSDRIQELHIMLIHTIIEGVERILFPQNY
jgi:D-sedoheptulose 7-phosphate isomerase